MKDFLKYTLATIVGVIIVSTTMMIIGVISLVGIVASEQTTPGVKENSVLSISLSGQMDERGKEDLFGKISGNAVPTLGLDDIMSAIRKAKDNDKIKGIYLEAGMFAYDSPASVQALRKQLADFRKSGKWIVAYADRYTQFSYYLCSVADKVYLNPQGMIDWHGLAAQPMFFKDLLAKFGVRMQLAKVGKYKSAPEAFTADKMSGPNREQVAAYINGIWDVVLTDVAQSRKISKQTLNAYADNLIMTANPKEYVTMKLVDKLLYTDEVKGEIKKRLGIDADETICQLTVGDMKNVPSDAKENGGEVAVYYAYGDVVDTKAGGLDADACIAADEVCRDLEALADDDDVKAVVLRVNSGGGSAYASEQIWNSVVKLKAKKPVVMSMGGMAASGGYYLGCASSYIYAEPTTLTGSIGIFGMFPDLSGLLTDKLGLKFDEVKTNKFSAFGTMARPFNEEEMAYLNAYIDRGYKLFVTRVSDGRSMSVADVDSIAQGRVWLGTAAKKVKLVDDMGGVYDAIGKAAELAKLGEYHTKDYPEPQDWVSQLLTMSVSKDNYLDEKMRSTLGEYYAPFAFLTNLNRMNAIQARMPYQLIVK